jgi:hypothetical protein
MTPEFNSEEARLDRLIAGYRDSIPQVEPSPNFMPDLWGRIESRQRFTRFIGRLTSGFVTTAVALSLGLLYLAPNRPNAPVTGTYVEALDATHAEESFDYYDPFHAGVNETIWTDELR